MASSDQLNLRYSTLCNLLMVNIETLVYRAKIMPPLPRIYQKVINIHHKFRSLQNVFVLALYIQVIDSFNLRLRIYAFLIRQSYYRHMDAAYLVGKMVGETKEKKWTERIREGKISSYHYFRNQCYFHMATKKPLSQQTSARGNRKRRLFSGFVQKSHLSPSGTYLSMLGQESQKSLLR